MSRRRAFTVVDAFEEEVAAYTGAPYAVAVDSGTNAIFLALEYVRKRLEEQVSVSAAGPAVHLPKRTYLGVAQAARNAGFRLTWDDRKWQGQYQLGPWGIWDSCQRLTSGMFADTATVFPEFRTHLMALSFAASKILPIGRGGAILTDSLEAVAWLKRARFLGRTEGETCDAPATVTTPGWSMTMTPEQAARGLHLLTYLPPKDNPDQGGSEDFPDLSAMEAFR